MLDLHYKGLVCKDLLEKSYIETISVIEEEVNELLKQTEGKTVVSADHGENLGEIQHRMKHIGHGNPTPECRYVPWLEVDCGARKKITEGEPIGFDTIDSEVVNQRLIDLGYK
jgi:hypothetical protein